MKIEELNISEEIKKAVNKMGYTELMEIQEKVIPLILKGNDVIGQAQTGTGKTAAFGIPLIQMSSTRNKGVEHIIISPTRELAIQIKREIETLAEFSKIKVISIVGGTDYTKEIRLIKTNPNIVVATPGRLLDHLNNHRIDLSNILTLTLDEADEMLQIGFKDELDKIIDYMPKERQSLLFSATIDKNVYEVVNKLTKNPIKVLVSSGLNSSDSVKQYGMIVDEREKLKTLIRIIETENPKSALIFGRTKKRVDELTKALNTYKISAKGLHGDLSQRERERIMDGFRHNEFSVLIATDVAARGIHVDDISFVINFDLPQEVEYYVHRIGRTGRAGTIGKSISFIRECEMEHVRLIEEKTNSKIEIIGVPSMTKVKEIKNDKLKETVLDLINNEEKARYYGLADELLESYDARDIVAAVLNKISPKINVNKIVLSGEPPVRIKFIRKPVAKKKDFKSRNRKIRFKGNNKKFDK